MGWKIKMKTSDMGPLNSLERGICIAKHMCNGFGGCGKLTGLVTPRKTQCLSLPSSKIIEGSEQYIYKTDILTSPHNIDII